MTMSATGETATPLTPREVFERELARWPLELISERSRAQLRPAVAALPPFCTGLFVECHLAHPDRTDVAARLLPADRDAVLTHASATETWGEFLKAWQNPRSPIAALPAIDVEVDLVEGPLRPFICPSFGSKLLQGNTPFYAMSAFELSVSALRLLWPDLPQPFADNIERIRDNLPAGTVFFPGWPLRDRGANPGSKVRGFLNTSHEALGEVLGVLRWQGNVDEVVSVANTLCPRRPIIALDCDLTADGVGERLGIGYDVPWVRASDRQLNAMLLRLEDSGWCHPRRIAGLKQWVAEREPSADTPSADTPSADRQWRALTLKVLLTGTAALQPKCYLSTFDLG